MQTSPHEITQHHFDLIENHSLSTQNTISIHNDTSKALSIFNVGQHLNNTNNSHQNFNNSNESRTYSIDHIHDISPKQFMPITYITSDLNNIEDITNTQFLDEINVLEIDLTTPIKVDGDIRIYPSSNGKHYKINIVTNEICEVIDIRSAIKETCCVIS